MPVGAAIGIGTVAAAGIQSNAAGRAARTQERAANRASDASLEASRLSVDEQRRQFDITQRNMAPWLESGRNALTRLDNPGANFLASPGYDFARTEGMRGIERTAAARGGAASGNALRSLGQFTTGLASGEYNNWWNQQAGLAGVGANTAQSLGAFGQATATGIGNALMGGANASGQALMGGADARASGIVGSANALSGALSNGIDSWLYFRNQPSSTGGKTRFQG